MSYAETFIACDSTWMARRDPRLKLAWLFAVSMACVLLDSHLGLFLVFGASVMVALTMGWGWRAWAIIGGVLAAIAWGTMISQALFYPQEPRTLLLTILPPFSINGVSFQGIQLYREGAFYGLVQSLRLLATTLAGLSLCLSTSTQRLLAALLAIRVPAAIGFMTVAALRFLPTALDEWAVVRSSARIRGYRPRLRASNGGIAATARTELSLVVPMLAAALRRSTNLAASITSRGFDASRPRTAYPPLRMSRLEKGLLCSLSLLLGTVAVLKSIEWMETANIIRSEALMPFARFASIWL